MPDVDWEKVAADLADLTDDPSLFVEWFAFADYPGELIDALRWGLEAQQRGATVIIQEGTLIPLSSGIQIFDSEGCRYSLIGTARAGTHLLVPLEGEQ